MFSSIRARIIAACVAIVAAALLASTLINYFIARSYNDDAIDRNLTSVASGHVVGIGDWVATKSRMIASLQDAALSPDPLPVYKQMAAAGGFTNVYAGYADKTFKFSDPTGIPADYDPTGRPWYKQAAQAGKPVVTPPYVDAGTGNLVVTFAVPIMRDGAVKGVVAADVAMNAVIANVKSIHPTPASFGMLIDSNGHVVAHPDSKLTLKPVNDVSTELGAIAPASIVNASAPVEVEVGGAAKLVRALPVPGTDWYALVALDKSEATAGMRSLLTASLITLVADIVIASLIVGAITATAFRRLSLVRQAMAAIGSGSGDLTQRLPADGGDEVTDIARSFNSFVDKLQEVMQQIRDASESVRTAANEIAAGNQDLSSRTEAAAASLEETAASMEEITATVGQSAAAAGQADQRAEAASKIASHGGVVVSDVVSTMEKIEEASGRIGDIIGVIDGIAFQTNILALNAAVEAARAGEQGRGFAVVAQEVRSLAQRSAQAAREVKVLVESTVASVEAGSGQVRQAGETMREIVTNVANVTTIISEITHAANEQTRGIQEVNRAVTQLDEMVQQNAALVEQSTAAAAALQTQAHALAATVGQFKVS
ncbi:MULTISPECIES: methyl-accepting chemotaxis protein [Burkholderia]|uniref:methyl-accepting chemotaxis protein n=1 Tax=Burkholderia TaxID=32008 RepID=UPI0005ACCF67|nr:MULTISPECIES: methyl-accepting chemotaxis protein [Burkholderia]KIP13816.1 methyl-accepting chemotaxis (MCP) signaling domain protein [Burkholderia sp. MSHR3999]KVG78045.1 chemotaxis protein [Burkholderia ubonensis]KVO90273.1 chemotaxis protein [Burkholderia ubonensis]KVP45204.1 chemotaxis protein [Burkholderia ubonensis]KVR68000.1 chemotaxis protein [Burkholderia ubonensis]